MATLKRFFIPFLLLLLLLFLLSLGWATNKILTNSASSLFDSTIKIEKLVKEHNWSKAQKIFQQTEKKWAHIGKYWPLLIHHQEMDRIEESISKIKSFLEHQDSNNALAEIYLLKNLVQHIPKSKALNLQNIF